MADRYVKGQLLGKGSFGAAYLVTCKADGQKYVLKEIDISRMQRSEREAAEQEAKVSYPIKLTWAEPLQQFLTGLLTRRCCKLCIIPTWSVAKKLSFPAGNFAS